MELELRPLINAAYAKGLALLKVSKFLRLSQWMAKHFYLSAESSYVEQHWEAYPYQPAIADCMSNDEIEEFDWIKPSRVGYTKIICALIGYTAEHLRRNLALWQPTDTDSDLFCKTEVDTMLRDVPVMERVFPHFMRRHKDNTLNLKKFLGSVLHLLGGKAEKNYRRITVDTGITDELDGFDRDVEKTGSPIKLVGKRVEGATFPKQIRGSTPKIKNYSMIEASAAAADEYFQYHIPCPSCGVEHVLDWGEDNSGKKIPDKGFVWTDGPESVAHLCPHCSVFYTQAEYLSVWHRGRWISKNDIWITKTNKFKTLKGKYVPTPRHVAFHIWSAYSPQVSWAQIVRDYISAEKKAAAGDDSEMKTFRNNTLAQSYEVQVEKADEHELMQRAEDYPLRVVQMGGLMLVAGVDVHDTNFTITVWAFGRGEEMWLIDYVVIDANPADKSDWELLDNYLKTTFPHQAGTELNISAAAIDTGGHFTHEVYNFCRRRVKRRIYAIHGSKEISTPIKGRSSNQDVNYMGKVIKRGVKLWSVGVHNAKNLLFGRLKIEKPEKLGKPTPGYIHFSKDLPLEFYEQLTAEHRIPVKTSRGESERWVAMRPNHVLDCTNYAIFAAHMRGVHVYTDKMWQKLEDKVQPVNGILFGPEGAPAPTDLASPPKTYQLDKDKKLESGKAGKRESEKENVNVGARRDVPENDESDVVEQEEQKPKRKARRRRKTGFVHNY